LGVGARSKDAYEGKGLGELILWRRRLGEMIFGEEEELEKVTRRG
jgi:hypothetical protein